MKRYLIFQYDKYYPCGGFHDFINAHDTLEEATKEFTRIVKDLDLGYGFCDIVDMETLKIVRSYEKEEDNT